MKKKLLALSIMAASLIVSTALLNHKKTRPNETLSLILSAAAISVVVMAAPNCRKRDQPTGTSP